ncbi:MAG: biopolymer transporter ExbD [Bacteroidota bacterium]|nr:biopolymer transporter ExbD [Bacteroidota bacterium]
MAEINLSAKKSGKKHLQKNIRVDLTPMVDLGFLLITFFILTTTMEEPNEMKLFLPKDSTDSTLVEQSTTLTFVLSRNDSIGYYDGFAKEIQHSKFDLMRNIIQQKQINLTKNHLDKNKLTIIIKPSDESSYKNFIDALDEVSINDCRHYFVAEPGKNDVF